MSPLNNQLFLWPPLEDTISHLRSLPIMGLLSAVVDTVAPVLYVMRQDVEKIH